MNTTPQEMKHSLISYFKSGEGSGKCLGVEIEHFTVEKETGKAVPYAGKRGVQAILQELETHYDIRRDYREEDYLGFETEEFTITLEPAAQVEISIAPKERIASVKEIYEDFRAHLDPILSSYGYELSTLGYQPKSRVDDLILIPKERYRLMDAHFSHTGDGHGGREMMRGTASTQISIDYSSEADFREKIRAIAFLTPLIQLLCDNVTAFEGSPFSGHLKRTDIWRRTDPARCGLPPHIFDASYGYGDYADYLLDMPMILFHKGETTLSTGMDTPKEIYAERDFDTEDVRHVLSMAFPDVRLKSYLEIRGADSLPKEKMLAYCAFIKGILYSGEGLKECGRMIRDLKIGEGDVQRAQDDLMEKGWQGMLYGQRAEDFAAGLLKLAERNLPREEQEFLLPFLKERGLY